MSLTEAEFSAFPSVQAPELVARLIGAGQVGDGGLSCVLHGGLVHVATVFVGTTSRTLAGCALAGF